MAKHVTVVCLKQHVQDFDDERAAAQRACQAVLAQETLELRLVLGNKFQCNFSAYDNQTSTVRESCTADLITTTLFKTLCSC